MTLSDLLEVLAENTMLNIQIKDSQNVLIEFAAPGYESLSTEILEKNVEKVVIDSLINVVPQITVILTDN